MQARRSRKPFRRSGSFYVYIVTCSDRTYYTGYTPDLDRRVKLHNAGKGAKYTRDRRPVKLSWAKRFAYFKLAYKAERSVKKLGRHKKDLLVKYFRHPRRAWYERMIFARRKRMLPKKEER